MYTLYYVYISILRLISPPNVIAGRVMMINSGDDNKMRTHYVFFLIMAFVNFSKIQSIDILKYFAKHQMNDWCHPSWLEMAGPC